MKIFLSHSAVFPAGAFISTILIPCCAFLLSVFVNSPAYALDPGFKAQIYQVPELKPIDSKLKVKVGDKAPDFTLPSTKGDKLSLGSYQGKKNVMLSFVPAAFTPICSDQWPGYNITREFFDKNETVLIGITTDNVPSLFA